MALTTNSLHQTDGVFRRAYGQIVSDAGAAAILTLNLGFAPLHFKIVNLTDRIVDEWYEGMASANSLHTVAAGTSTLETTNGVAVLGNTVTLTATTMVASKSFFWEAEG